MEKDYTLVVGVDFKHLCQLRHTWPTWKRHKPSLLLRPMIIFFDRDQLDWREVVAVVDHPFLTPISWPPSNISGWVGDGKDKWSDPQRFKMLTGFVHVPASFVETPYWLKIDTDVVAIGNDAWVDETWWDGTAIIAHGWSFTKPPDQMDILDQWTKEKGIPLPLGPLNLHPTEDSTRLGHKRIISWCGFFEKEFTAKCSAFADVYHEPFHLPVASQDGYMWYMAKRLGLNVRRENMKSRGWQQWSTSGNVERYAKEAMKK